VLYFIGNKSASNVYENFEGKAEQKNDGHFLELAGALSVMDFCKNIESYKVVDGLSVNQTQIKEFGIENDTDSITFNDLNIENVKQLSSPLTKFRLYTEYLTKGLPIALNISRWTKSNIKLVNRIKNSSLDINYFNSAEYMVQIKAFNKYFSEWINEMGNNKPSFCPFYEINAEDALKLVKNKVPKGDLSFKALDVKNCLLIDQVSIKSPLDKKHTTLIKLFGQSTEDILAHKNLLIQ
jgi:hypothetical protein